MNEEGKKKSNLIILVNKMAKESFSKETFQTFADAYYEKYEKKKEESIRARASHISNNSFKSFIQPIDH